MQALERLGVAADARFALDEAELKPYFALPAMVGAAFDCAQRLFGLRFVRRADLPAYHGDVEVYEVRAADGAEVGLFLLPFAAYALFLIASRANVLAATSWPIQIVGGLVGAALALTVFFLMIAYAIRAHGLGGWLHEHTRFVAANMMRSERRRQLRERQAAQMNAIEDHTESNLAQVAPMLDDAIGQLEAEDRKAILLRFFERQDYRSVGEALGSSEDAARKRVDRAVDDPRLVRGGERQLREARHAPRPGPRSLVVTCLAGNRKSCRCRSRRPLRSAR